MDHDELANRPTNPTAKGDDLLPDLAMQIGGGLSLALMASLNRPASIILFSIGGRLPILAWSLSAATAQVIESITGFAPRAGSDRPSALPAPHLATKNRPMVVGRLGRVKAEASR